MITECGSTPPGSQITVNVDVVNLGYSTPTPTVVPTATHTPPPATPSPTPTATPTLPPGDPYEPNDSYWQTYTIPGFQLNQEYIYNATISHSEDQDWFEFTIPQNSCEICKITVDLTNIPSGTDYDLELYGSDPLDPLDSSLNSGNQSENIGYNVSVSDEGDVFRVRVFPYYEFDPINQYQLKIKVTDLIPIAYEPNNHPEQAYALPVVDGQELEIVAAIWPADDVDWYKFYVDVPTESPLEGDQIVQLWLEDIPVGSNYDIQLFYATGELLSSSEHPQNGDEYISFQISESGWYYIRIRSIQGFSAEQGYKLRILYRE